MGSAVIYVRLLSFGPLKAAFGKDGVWRELPEGESVGSLMERLRVEGTVSEPARRALAVAVNQEYATLEHVLEDGDEVALLPPVSGGTGLTGDPPSGFSKELPSGFSKELPSVSLVREPVDAAAMDRAIKAGADGAVCVFDGIVRDNTRGRATLHLDYEAYEEMALRQMQMLRREAIERYAVREVAIVHRLGRLMVGETSVYIVVASAHRGAAFEACRYVIDTLKKTVPIWKREQFVDGAVWADGEPFPEEIVGTR